MSHLWLYPSITRILLVTILINQWDIVINQRVLLLHPSWSILTLINPQPSMSDFIGRYLQIHSMPRKWCGVNALWPSPCNLAIFDMFDTQKDTPWCTKNLVPSWVKMELECACFSPYATIHFGEPMILNPGWTLPICNGAVGCQILALWGCGKHWQKWTSMWQSINQSINQSMNQW